jgi:hypothetical protein
MDEKRAETLRAREAVKVALSALLSMSNDPMACVVGVTVPNKFAYTLEQVNARTFIVRAYAPSPHGGLIGLHVGQGAGETLDEALAALWVD